MLQVSLLKGHEENSHMPLKGPQILFPLTVNCLALLITVLI